MAATTVTIPGNLSDFAVTPRPDLHPVLHFIPTGITSSGNQILFPYITPVTPDSSGNFTVTVPITEGLTPDVGIRVRVDWIDNVGQVADQDWFPGQLRIPINGGTLATLIQTSNPGSYVIVSEEMPTAAYIYWYQPSTGNLTAWS
ncbi:hypothetical protein B7R21_06265 [Subtercola boreus]|uniref:Uncharacterized protein n=1 Tax=Subtercola boreus TaxID=120213 RepID=A0A3E0VXD9_9MICO|nr:hypothetical protein [Subtercola boreus]RFA14546.1 hypothetical protein B7R21_06265 [Subtercola boreus]